jgi:hypothetical protein
MIVKLFHLSSLEQTAEVLYIYASPTNSSAILKWQKQEFLLLSAEVFTHY